MGANMHDYIIHIIQDHEWVSTVVHGSGYFDADGEDFFHFALLRIWFEVTHEDFAPRSRFSSFTHSFYINFMVHFPIESCKSK